MRCRPRPGSRFYSLDRLLCRRECWEPLYDLITPPLRRGRNARRHSGIRHVLAPPPDPSLRGAGFSLFSTMGPHPPLGCFNLHALGFTLFSSSTHQRRHPALFQVQPRQQNGQPKSTHCPLGDVYVSIEHSRP